MALQRASATFGITRKKFLATGVFDPVIGVDSLFFLDPLRLRRTTIPEFRGSLDKVRNYYRRILTLIRRRS